MLYFANTDQCHRDKNDSKWHQSHWWNNGIRWWNYRLLCLWLELTWLQEGLWSLSSHWKEWEIICWLCGQRRWSRLVIYSLLTALLGLVLIFNFRLQNGCTAIACFHLRKLQFSHLACNEWKIDWDIGILLMGLAQTWDVSTLCRVSTMYSFWPWQIANAN